MKRILLALLIALSAPAQAGSFYTGNTLLGKCESTFVGDTGLCMGYIAGALDAYGSVSTCPPDTVTLGQAVDVVKKFLRDQPQVRNEVADVLLFTLFKATWPCAERPRQPSRGPV